MSGVAIKAGDVFVNEYPFIRTTFDKWDEDGVSQVLSWKPGVDYEPRGYCGDDFDAVADGIGKQILAVVDVHKPGRFPTRVFYTCKWVSPDGKTFGKGKLRITTIDAFRRRARGFMSHDPFFDWRLRKARGEQS